MMEVDTEELILVYLVNLPLTIPCLQHLPDENIRKAVKLVKLQLHFREFNINILTIGLSVHGTLTHLQQAVLLSSARANFNDFSL